MADRDKIGFISVPWCAVPSVQPGSMGIMVDMTSRHLPPECRSVVVSGTYNQDPGAEAEGVEYHRLVDRADRFFFKPLSELQSLVPGLKRDYHFRSYFHRAYIRRAAAVLAEQKVKSIVFPLYPQWAGVLKKACPDARLVLWMQCEWLSAGPASYEKYLKKIDRVVCCSEYIRDKIAQRYPWAGDRLSVVPNGVDTRQFVPSRSASRHQILYAGRLTPEKGAHVLIKAFEKIREHYIDAQLVLAGPFWITPTAHLVGSSKAQVREWRRLGEGYELLIKREAQRLGNVFLTGAVNHKALVRMYRTAAVFVHPCLWNEPFGMILAEAMACGLPVVASNVGGIPEVIHDSRSGLLTEPGDVDGLVKAVERLFDSRDAASRFSQAARTRAEEEYDWKKVADRMARIALDMESGGAA